MRHQLSPANCWAMCRWTPHVCRPIDFARAVRYAASQGWLPGALEGVVPAAHALAKVMLDARAAYFRACEHQTDGTSTEATELIAMLGIVPDSWLGAEPSRKLIERLSALFLSSADDLRFMAACRRAAQIAA